MQSFLSSLIKFKTTSDRPEELKKCIDFVRKDLEKAGLKTKVFQKNEKYSLLASNKIQKHYKVILNGHLDVVPAEEKAFIPIVKGNRMYGRGTSDMKGFDVVMIEAVKEVFNENNDVSAAILLTTDEEVGGFDGAKYFVDLGYSADCVFIPDSDKNYNLVTEEKGIKHIKFSAKGKTAHGARPWLGDNAINKLIRVYNELEKFFGVATEEDDWKTSINLGKIEGGENFNSVPDFAQMMIDIRHPSNITSKYLLGEIERIVENEEGVKFEVTVEGDPMHTSEDNPYVDKIKDVCKSNLGREIKVKREHGGSDGRFFSAKGIPVIMIKGKCSAPHIENEWVDLNDLERFKEITKEFVRKTQTL